MDNNNDLQCEYANSNDEDQECDVQGAVFVEPVEAQEAPPVTITNDQKVGAITKANYAAIAARATELKERLTKAYQNGEAPSLRHMQQVWGYNISLKALCRHRKIVLERLGMTETPKPTLSLQRKKKAVEATEDQPTEPVEIAQPVEETSNVDENLVPQTEEG